MKLSIVATLYRCAPYINEFHLRATQVARQFAGNDYEIILVNDGSPLNDLDLAIKLVETDRHLVVVDLSRNFGHHKAIMTGLAQSRGEFVFLVDSDLEEEPEWLIPFAQALMETPGVDVVFGVQESRKGGWFERWSGGIFWNLINVLSGLSLPPNIVTARLMTRRYVNALLLHVEREVFLAGLWFITGFGQKSIVVRKSATSESTYTLRRKLSLFVNSLTSFSNMPLVGIFYLGLVTLLLALLYTGWLTIRWFFLQAPPAGWTSVMASIWLIGGMIISSMGIIGIYLSKVFSETKQRPLTIIREIHGRR